MGAPRTKDLHEVRDVQQLLSIGPNLNDRDVFYYLKLVDSDTLWKALLEVQFHLCKFAELPFLYRDPAFETAKRVLEVGHGDDGMVGGLAPHFPEKHFTNCSLATRHILGAKRKTKACLNDIEAQARGDGPSSFDYVILRIVVQQVSQLGYFISRMRDYLVPGGTLLVIDAYDSLLAWDPSIPTLEKLMKNLGAEQEKTGAGRTAAEKIHRRASLYGMRPRRSAKLAVSSDGAGELGRRNFYTYFLLLSEVMIRAFGPVLDQPALLADLDAWLAVPTARAQFGLHFVSLERVDG